MAQLTARTNMGIEFINVCGSGIFGILLSFCLLKILGLNFFGKNDIIILNKKTCLGYVVKMRKRGSVLIEWDLFLCYNFNR